MLHLTHRLALAVGVALSAGAAHAADPFFPAFGTSDLDVKRYDLALDVHGHALTGKAVLTVRAARDLQRFALDLRGLAASKVSVRDRAGSTLAASFAQSGGKLRVALAPGVRVRAEQIFLVTVDYGGKPAGIDDPTADDPAATLKLGWLNLGEGSYVVSEPVGASTFFPVNELVGDKAAYRFAITVDKPLVAVANGVPTGVTEVAGNRRRFTYEMAQPMASYLAIADIGRYTTEELGSAGGVPVRIVRNAATPANDLAALRRTPAMLAKFKGLLGSYPFASYGSISVADPDLYYALETQTISTFPNDLYDDPETGDVNEAEPTVAHELAHQWFGDALTVGNWRDLWLAEGFATYFEYLWQYRDSQADFDAAMASLYDYVKAENIGPAVVSRPEDIFADNTYYRGALTLQSLRLKVGDAAFWRTLRRYYGEFRNKNVTSEDFIKVAVAQGGQPGVRDLLQNWLYNTRLPAYGGPRMKVVRTFAPLGHERHRHR